MNKKKPLPHCDILLYEPEVRLEYPVFNNKNEVQEMIAYFARVSNPDNQHNKETSGKLLRYLIDHKHWSPFEMISVCMEIKTTRDIGRQILRHRSFSFQEFSQRYAVADLGFCLREPRLQDTKNRQNSIEMEEGVDKGSFYDHQRYMIERAKCRYDVMIECGMAKEQARSILPEGNIYTKMYMSGTMRSWMHYIKERTDIGTQKEHREVANLCADQLKSIFPLIKEFRYEK